MDLDALELRIYRVLCFYSFTSAVSKRVRIYSESDSIVEWLLCRTTLMAKDAVAIMDFWGWEKAHVFGHSMGESMSDNITQSFY